MGLFARIFGTGDRDRDRLSEVVAGGKWRRERIGSRVEMVESPDPRWGGQDKRMFVYSTELFYVNGEPVEHIGSTVIRFRDDEGELRAMNHPVTARRLGAATLRRGVTDRPADKYYEEGLHHYSGLFYDEFWKGFRRRATDAEYRRAFGLSRDECEARWREELREAWKARMRARSQPRLPGSKDYNRDGIVGRKG